MTTTSRDLSLFVTGALLLAGAHQVFADGERSPMVGLAAIGADSPRDHAGLAGVELDLAWWHGRIGLGAESSGRWSVADDARELVVGASARVRVYEHLLPSLYDPRDVELGVELQAIVERAWWNVQSNVDPTAYGLGLAIRIRGTGDPDGSNLLAESRFFVRVMSSRWSEVDALTRTTMPTSTAERVMTVLVGVGASFGSGTSSYMDRFRLRPFQPTLLW